MSERDREARGVECHSEREQQKQTKVTQRTRSGHLNYLQAHSHLNMHSRVQALELGQIMAKYYISFEVRTRHTYHFVGHSRYIDPHCI